MIESVVIYNEARQAAFRRRVIQARLVRTEAASERMRLSEALQSHVSLSEVINPASAFTW